MCNGNDIVVDFDTLEDVPSEPLPKGNMLELTECNGERRQAAAEVDVLRRIFNIGEQEFSSD